MDAGDVVGLTIAMTTDTPLNRKKAFKPAEPLEEHVLASLAFLKRVGKIQLTGGDKKTFQFTVHLHADAEDKLSKPSSFVINRTAQEIDRMSMIVQDACCRHFNLKAYNIPMCELCEPFKLEFELPVGTTDRLFQSTHNIQKTMEARVVALVRGAIVPPTNPTLFCEGVTRFPAAVTKFLLTGVDQTKL